MRAAALNKAPRWREHSNMAASPHSNSLFDVTLLGNICWDQRQHRRESSADACVFLHMNHCGFMVLRTDPNNTSQHFNTNLHSSSLKTISISAGCFVAWLRAEPEIKDENCTSSRWVDGLKPASGRRGIQMWSGRHKQTWWSSIMNVPDHWLQLNNSDPLLPLRSPHNHFLRGGI